ncbi:MAG: Ig-like domain-containing protein [Oceanipulchritudo sp.]
MKSPLLNLLFLVPLLASAVPVNVALNRPVVADSIYSPTTPPENAVDGNSVDDASRWLSGSGAYPHWIEVELGQTYSLSQMKFWTGKNGIGPFPLYDFALQYWDGSGWTDLYAETGSTNTGAVDVTFGPTVSGNRIRLYVTDGEDSIVRLFELEVYGEAHALTYNTLSPSNGGTLFDPAADIIVTFGSPVSASTLSGIRVEDLDTSTDLPGVSASVSGNDLIISHGGLNSSGSYAVHVPEGVVVLASDGTTPNGALYWEFETAPLKPQLVSYTNEVGNLTDPIELVFDRPINLLNAAGISLERFADGSAVGGLGVAVSGDTLTVTHDPLLLEEAYVLSITAGTVEGVINAEPNEILRLLVYGGSTVLFETDFDTGLEGFNTAHLLGLTTGTSSNIYWKWTNSGTGPDYDSEYVRSDTNYTDDFVVSPQVDLVAGRTYVLEFRAQLARALHVGVTPTASLADVEEIVLVSAGGPKDVRVEFTAITSGPQYLIFFSGETNPWQDQSIDAFLFTESVPPAVRINAPLDGSSHLEGASIPVEIEAFGIAGDLVSVEIFDTGVSRGLLTESGGLYTYDWTYHTPGEHTLRVEATDTRGNVSSDEVTVTVTFDDGTLPNFLGWTFDDGKQGWKFYVGGLEYLSGTAIKVLSSGTRQPGQEVVFNSKGSSELAISSPVVFLLAGESYTLQFDGQFSATSPAWGFMPTTVPGYPADTTGKTIITPASTSWNRYSYSFSVPANGAYHLTIFAPLSGYWGARIDDIRLIGNFNSAPLVSLTNPAANVTTFAGATINLVADASDPDGTVSLVEFVDAGSGQLLEPGATDTSAPWEFEWITSAPGIYEVAAVATDDTLGVSQSTAKTITVAPNNLVHVHLPWWKRHRREPHRRRLPERRHSCPRGDP